MTLSFDPLDSYVKMVMELSDEKLKQFFESMGIEIRLDALDEDTESFEEDEGLLYDCEG
jgi:hypothetical protein